jgi:hypothetical protein
MLNDDNKEHGMDDITPEAIIAGGEEAKQQGQKPGLGAAHGVLAMAMYSFYAELVEAGFNSEQALTLTQQALEYTLGQS